MNAIKKATFTGHHGGLYALAPGHLPETFFTGGADKMAVLWNIHSDTSLPFTIRTENTIYSLALDEKSNMLWIGTATGNIHVIDLGQKVEIKNFSLHKDRVFHLLWHEASGRTYACSGDGSVSVWDSSSLSLLHHTSLTDKKVRRAAISSDGTLAAFACGDGAVQVFHSENFVRLHEWEAHVEGATSLVFLPDGNLLTGGKDAFLRRWNVRTGFGNTLSVPAHNYAIYDLQISPGDRFLASVSRDKTVKLWNPEKLDQPLRLDRKSHGGHLHSVNACLWLNEKHLITCSDDRSAVLWEVYGG